MNHNISQFRELIEDCVDSNSSQFQQQETLEALLDVLPEEETDHVKAYRSLMFLVDYLEKRDYEKPDNFANSDPVEQLWRIRRSVRDDALEDIVDRIEIEDKSGVVYGNGSAAKIYDPVSKTEQRITNEQKQHDLVESNVEFMAHGILEAPL